MLSMEKWKDRFEVKEKIGNGAFGTVYKAEKKSDNKTIAIKKIKFDNIQGIPPSTMREISIVTSMEEHPNIIKHEDVLFYENRVLICLEFFPYDLRRFNRDRDDLCSNARLIIYQILKGLDFLHGQSILHRDIKPENILINETYQCKICDFGFSRRYGFPLKPYTKEVSTKFYQAPELLFGIDIYSTGIDIWSVGCIMFELLFKKVLFENDSDFEQIKEIILSLGTNCKEDFEDFERLMDYIPNELKEIQSVGFNSYIEEKYNFTIGAEALDLLLGLLTFNPSKRITAAQALKYAYFNNIVCPY